MEISKMKIGSILSPELWANLGIGGILNPEFFFFFFLLCRVEFAFRGAGQAIIA